MANIWKQIEHAARDAADPTEITIVEAAEAGHSVIPVCDRADRITRAYRRGIGGLTKQLEVALSLYGKRFREKVDAGEWEGPQPAHPEIPEPTPRTRAGSGNTHVGSTRMANNTPH